jgi:hypothetical protein
MKSKPIALLLTSATLSATLAFSQEVQRTPLRPDHPLLGVWRIDLPDQKCFEEYDLRANGTKLSQSAEERNESEFEISSEPSARGFYKWSDKIIKNNGKLDCGGSLTKVGHVAVNFVRLHPNGQKFLLCETEDMNTCFAEFYRKSRAA